jgi:hypothetical protein
MIWFMAHIKMPIYGVTYVNHASLRISIFGSPKLPAFDGMPLNRI